MPQKITKESAQAANAEFDRVVENFLRGWLIIGSPDNEQSQEDLSAINAFVDGGALREYFKRHDDPLEQLLRNHQIAKHLCRNHLKVYFDPETGEPLLSKFEQRIYNLAAHREHFQIPYRYTPEKRQGAHGDRAERHELSEEELKKGPNIGDYFGTRRADDALIKIVHRQIKHTIRRNVGMPVIHVAGAYLPNAVFNARHLAEALIEEHTMKEPFAIVMEQRHGFSMRQQRAATEPLLRTKENKHFGSAMLIFAPPHSPSAVPQRILFCDSLHYPGGQPDFQQDIRETFGEESVAKIELVGNPDLQEWNDVDAAYKQDVNCSFYTQSMVKALITMASTIPDKLLNGSTQNIIDHMRAVSSDYYDHGVQKERPAIQTVNLGKRWDVGRSMLLDLTRERQRSGRDEKKKSWVKYVVDRNEIANDVRVA